MTIGVVQYHLPNGRQTEEVIDDMPDDLAPILVTIKAVGLRLAAEILATGVVSFTLESQEHGDDFDIELAQNGPGEHGTAACLERLIRRFTEENYAAWVKEITA